MRVSAFILAFILGLVAASSHTLGASPQFKSTSDVSQAMCKEQRHVGGCYLLLNSTGKVGCEAPDATQHVLAPIINIENLRLPLNEPRAVLVPTHKAEPFIVKLQGLHLQQKQGQAQDDGLLQHVKAVLVLHEDGAPLPASQSSALKFPGGAEWAPYFQPLQPTEHVWNPYGSGTSRGYLPIPVFRVAGELASDARMRANENHQTAFSAANHCLEAELSMSAQANSTACIEAGTCKPLGGFNVWAAVPPQPFNQTSGLPLRSTRPVTLITAQMNADGIFHDSMQAADSPLSGLLAMLTTMHVLKAAGAGKQYTRQLVFVGLAGEPFGYMGSRRLLWDMHAASNASVPGGSAYGAGLNLEDVDQVIELGSVGRAHDVSTNVTKLFAHSQALGGKWGDTSKIMDELQSASQDQSALGEPCASLQPASPSNPGLPPSSLYSFLRAKPAIAGVFLAEFDREFVNPYYHGDSYDNASFISASAIAATAATLAKALHSMASGQAEGAPLKVNMTDTMAFSASLIECVATETPGMACPLARSLLNPDYQVIGGHTSYAVSPYVGVLSFIHSEPQNPLGKKTLHRFLWNLMGLLASEDSQQIDTQGACAFASRRCPAGQECIGWKGSTHSKEPQLGRCKRTTVRYSLSLPTVLDFNIEDGPTSQFFFSNKSEPWNRQLEWPPEPVWAESNWPRSTPLVRIMQRESQATERAVFTAGLLVFTSVALLCWWIREERQPS